MKVELNELNENNEEIQAWAQAQLSSIDKINKYIFKDSKIFNFDKTQTQESIDEYKALAQAKRDRKNAKRLKYKS